MAATIDVALQGQEDAQLLENGAFAPLELLIDTGRLSHGDYEAWRRQEIDCLDGVLMGSKEKIRAQLEAAAGYAHSIGLVAHSQTFHAWDSNAGDSAGKPLRISADPRLHSLITSRYVPAQIAPQLDLFFDNPVVALTNGIVRALSARNIGEAQRQLDRLYIQAPNHVDLAAFDRLLAALGHLHHTIEDPRQELDFLLEIAPTAKRLLVSQARDLLAPLWRQVADRLGDQAFSSAEPALHRSFALAQAQDWSGVRDSIRGEPQWWSHAPLCLRLAQSCFYQPRRIEALEAWCHLCWREPAQAADVLDHGRQPDTGITLLWQQFIDSEEEFALGEAGSEPALTAADFPAWLLLHEPGLHQQIAEDLPTGNTPAEENYRCVHRWLRARRANRHSDEIALRKTLQANHPLLFRYLKHSVAAA
jgi:hypothetical protein